MLTEYIANTRGTLGEFKSLCKPEVQLRVYIYLVLLNSFKVPGVVATGNA